MSAIETMVACLIKKRKKKKRTLDSSMAISPIRKPFKVIMKTLYKKVTCRHIAMLVHGDLAHDALTLKLEGNQNHKNFETIHQRQNLFLSSS